MSVSDRFAEHKFPVEFAADFLNIVNEQVKTYLNITRDDPNAYEAMLLDRLVDELYISYVTAYYTLHCFNRRFAGKSDLLGKIKGFEDIPTEEG